MKIAITGYNGMLGRLLRSFFSHKGWKIILVERRHLYAKDQSLLHVLEGADVVIHLSGAPIISRWTSSRRKEIYDSRVLTTRNLATAIRNMEYPPGLFISLSATGIYDDGGPYSESNGLLSPSFIGILCQDWEREAFVAEDACRVVVFRMGVILDKNGGALRKMIPFFSAGIGGPIGDGKQYFSWIHKDDAARAFDFVIQEKKALGIFNLTAPQVINNSQFTRALAVAMHRPAFLRVPPFLLWLLFGKGSTLLTRGQAVLPVRLEEMGFSFHHPLVLPALQSLFKPE